MIATGIAYIIFIMLFVLGIIGLYQVASREKHPDDSLDIVVGVAFIVAAWEEAEIARQALAGNDTAPSDAATEALRLAESFISGFEDDESQEGIPELLAKIRAALA